MSRATLSGTTLLGTSFLGEIDQLLTKEEYQELITKWDTNQDYVKQTLINKNLRLVLHEAKKFLNTGYPLDELFSEGCLGLIKAVNTFDPQKGFTFATYTSKLITNDILIFLRKQKKHRNQEYFEDTFFVDKRGELINGWQYFMNISTHLREPEHVEDNLMKEVTRQELNKAITQLNPTYRKIVKLKYIQGKTQKEVSVILGVSQSWVSRMETQMLKDLRKILKKADVI
jgi:RNA polymerase sporulation-specific sigma factor